LYHHVYAAVLKVQQCYIPKNTTMVSPLSDGWLWGSEGAQYGDWQEGYTFTCNLWSVDFLKNWDTRTTMAFLACRVGERRKEQYGTTPGCRGTQDVCNLSIVQR
jgi:hypothetical protein